MFVRAVLDTCTVRNHTDDINPKITLDLVRERRDLVRMSLPASAFVELTRQLAEGDLPFTRWKERIPGLGGVLDPRWPCLPNGRQLAWLAGTQTIKPIENIEDESRHMRACWHHLLEVKPEELGKCQVVYRVSNGSLRSIRLDYQRLKQTIAGERQDWIDYIRKMRAELPTRGIAATDERALAALMRADFGNDPLDAPGLGEKLDAASRMMARFVARSLPSKMPAYNPESEKRRGDAFDVNLLFYVPLPAVIVTGDGRFVRGLRETGAPHARQVLTIEEFNAELSKGSLTSLVEDFQTRERQHRQHCEAAYFRWEQRDRPGNDDWNDWFTSEPVA
ncbi:MAG: DUF2934 domain-containing protein [Isosphaeraceae bacterium]